MKCAVRWLKTNAGEYGIDPENIAVIGGSAGGHLAMMLGYSDDDDFPGNCEWDSVSARVQAIVDFYGPYDLTTEYARTHSLVGNFLGASYSESPQIYERASPKNYITVDDPPTLIFQGTIDELVPVSQSDSLHIKLDNTGVPNEYHRLKGWPHTMDLASSVNKYCQFYMMRFFMRTFQQTQPL